MSFPVQRVTDWATWIAPSRVRHFPGTPARRSVPLTIEAALHEPFSFQVAMRARWEQPQNVRVELAGPPDWVLRVRRIGYVPVRHHNTPVSASPADVDGVGRIPGYVPDPLLDEDAILLPASETHAFWVTVQPPAQARPGRHRLTVRLSAASGEQARHTVDVRLYDVVVNPRQGFPVTHWFYADALIDWYKTALFDDRFWNILPRYLENLTAHGQDMVYVPVFTPPLDGVKRPSQLLRVTRPRPRQYRFDWRDVKQYVDTARTCGIRRFEWCHPFTQWGAERAIRVYAGQGQDEKLLWPATTGATSETYRGFLGQYLPELHRFLARERLLEHSHFHVSDEPHGQDHTENYRRARALLKDLAPWMQVMDAVSDIEFGRQKLTDLPVPSISKVLDFLKEGIECGCYYCCGPRGAYLNHLLDTPLAKVAMHGFLFYRWPIKGFLHWGYNYWYESQTRRLIDPYSVQDGLRWPGWAYGDTFLVYPGADGPVDSMRWEVFAEALRDYALLQTLGVERNAPPLTAIRSFSDFPKTDRWRLRARSWLLNGAVRRARRPAARAGHRAR